MDFWRGAMLLASLSLVGGTHYTTQRFDGYYNNLANPSWGSKGRHIANVFPVSYVDGTYTISEEPNPRQISSQLFRHPEGLKEDHPDANALFAYFGQLVADEIVDIGRPTCPREIHGISIEENDPTFPQTIQMPYERKEYDKATGLSLGNPRKQLNSATSFIDGSVIYGTAEVWSDAMRTFEQGQFKTTEEGKLPDVNPFGLPMDNFPTPGPDGNLVLATPTEQWALGNPHAHENPALLSLGIMWMRFHNIVAMEISMANSSVTDQEAFERARRVVIASLQKAVFYEWLPILLREDPADFARNNPYKYDPSASPDVTSLYAAGSQAWFKTLMPAAVTSITPADQCTTVRLCNQYYSGQQYLSNSEGDMAAEIIRGLNNQRAAKNDQYIVEDFLDYLYGPLHYSRRDFGAQSILTGRDLGISDMPGAVAFFLNDASLRHASFDQLMDALDVSTENRRWLASRYGNTTRIDLLPLLMVEGSASNMSSQPFGAAIIREQFMRIRSADRFWFENPELNSSWPDEDRARIEGTTLTTIVSEVFGVSVSTNPFVPPMDPVPCDTPSGQVEECRPGTTFDYFAGNEAAFIISWIWLAAFPFAVIGIAYGIYRYKQRQIKIENKKKRKKLVDYSNLKDTHKHIAYDWNSKLDVKPVQVYLCPKKVAIHVLTISGRPMRCVDVGHYDTVTVFHSSTGKFYFHVFVPKEYDLVLLFDDLEDKKEFMEEFITFLNRHKKLLVMNQTSHTVIETNAVTKNKRKETLNKFFRQVFAQALGISYSEQAENGGIADFHSTVECEVNKEEFADALGLKPNSDFVQRMFSVADKSGRGFLKFREILELVIMLGKGTGESKFRLLFEMFDINKDGCLSHTEVNTLVKSMLDMASSKVEGNQLDRLVDEMYEAADLTGVEDLSFDQFKQLMTSNGQNMMDDVSVEFKFGKDAKKKKGGKKGPQKKGQQKKGGASEETSGSRHNLVDLNEMEGVPPPRMRQRGGAANGEGPAQMRGRSKSLALSNRLPIQSKNSKFDDVMHYFENHKSELGILFLFYAICTFLFAERFYWYAVATEHVGARRVLGYGVSFARGSAECISFTFSILLLTMCYNMIRYLRETFLNLYIPFDENIVFHKLVAWTALFFTSVHVVSYGFNYYHMTASPAGNLCFFDELTLGSNALVSFAGLLYNSLAGITGVLIILVLSVMYVFASQTARRYMHTAFWMTHKLFIALYIFILLHGLLRLTQSPSFYLYFIGPCLLFVIDKLISISRRKVKLAVLRSDLLPSGVTRVVFKRPPHFEYKSGMWVRVAVDALGASEYHPFTLTSSPHEDFLSLHIRAVGPWTQNIRSLLDPDNGHPSPSVYVDGPFGSGQQDWYNFEVSVLVGAGIGVTPYASILKDFVNMMRAKQRFKIRCQKVYFIWSTSSQRNFEWLIDILKQVEDVDIHDTVSINIFITQFFQKFDLRTTMLYVFEQHSKQVGGKSLFTGLRANTNFGRPDFREIFHKVHDEHPKVKKIGVFSCGPQGVTKGVEKGSLIASSETPALFKHHYENF